MAKDTPDQPNYTRSPYGPRALGALLPALTRPIFKKKSPGGATLMADWPTIIGPALAGITTPKRLSAGTLTIGCTGPVAMELSHLAPQLIARINGHLGRTVVERLRFVQQAGIAPRPASPPPAVEVAVPSRVAAAVAALPPGELREALAKLARGVYRKPG